MVGEKMARGNLCIILSHTLGVDEALRRIQGLLGDVKRKYGDKITAIAERWEGGVNTFQITVCRCSVSGTLIVQPEQLILNGNIPFPASLAKGKIESVIRDQMKILIA